MACTQIQIKTLSHPVLTGEIIDFIPSVSAIAIAVTSHTSGDVNVNNFVYGNSASILDVDTVVQNNSAVWGTGGGIETDPIFTTWAVTNSAHYQSTYSTVNSNSSFWNYQGTDLKSISGNWQSTYSTVNSNSSFWINVPETDPVFNTWALSNSAHYQSTYSTVSTNSSLWINVPETDPIFTTWALANSSHYQSTYSTVSTNSSSWVNVPETDPIFNTWAISNSAHYQSTYSTVNGNSSSWTNAAETDPVFNTWALANSAHYQSTYSTVNSNSAAWGSGTGSETDPIFTTWALANSGNYQSTYSIVNANSSIWINDTLKLSDIGVKVPPMFTIESVAYLSTHGDDTTGNGSFYNPYATLQKAYDSNYRCFIFLGEGYFDTLTINSAASIRIHADGAACNIGTIYVNGSYDLTVYDVGGLTVTIGSIIMGADGTDVPGILDLFDVSCSDINSSGAVNLAGSTGFNAGIVNIHNLCNIGTILAMGGNGSEINLTVPTAIFTVNITNVGGGSDIEFTTLSGTQLYGFDNLVGAINVGASTGNSTTDATTLASAINSNGNVIGISANDNGNGTITVQYNITGQTQYINWHSISTDINVSGVSVGSISGTGYHTSGGTGGTININGPSLIQGVYNYGGTPSVGLDSGNNPTVNGTDGLTIVARGAVIVDMYQGATIPTINGATINNIFTVTDNSIAYSKLQSGIPASKLQLTDILLQGSQITGPGKVSSNFIIEADPVFGTWAHINSALYTSAYTNLNTNSALWIDTRNTVFNNSAIWTNAAETDPVFSTWAISNSAHYQSTYSTVNTNSSSWVNSAETDPIFNTWALANSGNYQSTYSTVGTNSGNWQNVYVGFQAQSGNNYSVFTTVNSNSALWINAVETDPIFNTWAIANSAHYQSTYSTVNTNSASWTNAAETDPIFSTWAISNSAHYQSTYSTVLITSAMWASVYTTVNTNSSIWNNANKIELMFAVSDESTAVTTGAGKLTFRMPYAMTLSNVRSNVFTPPSGSALIVDLKQNGSTVFGNKLYIDSGAKTSITSISAMSLSASALADDAQMTVDIIQIGSTVAGAGLKLTMIGTRP